MMKIQQINTSFILTIILAACLFGGCASYTPPFTLDPRAKQVTSDRTDAYYHYMKGVLRSLDQDIEGAIEDYTIVADLSGRPPFLVLELATLYLQKDESRRAAELLESSLRSHPDHLDTLIMLGTIYVHLEEFDKAIACYRTAIKQAPDVTDSYILLAVLYKNRQDYSAAQQILEELLSRDFENFMAAYQLAHVYLEMRDLDQAKYWLRRAMTIDPGFSAALKELAMIYEYEQDTEKAIELYRRYLELQGSDMALRRRLGNMLLNEGYYREAAKEFETIIDQGGMARDLDFSLALSLFFGRINFDRAAELLLGILETSPDNHRSRYFLGAVYQEEGNERKALEQFEAIPSESDFFAPSRIQMALIANTKNEYERAIAILNEAIKREAEESDLYLALASLYEERGQIDRAAAILREGLDLMPAEIEIMYRLGFIYEKTGRFKESIDMMRTILEIDPDNAEAMNFIGYTYADRDIHLEEAEDLILEALRLKPGSGHIIDSLGWVYFRQNRIDEAIARLEEAFHLLPDDPIIAEHLGKAYEKSGLLEDALKMYRKALEKTPDNETLRERIERIERPRP